MKQVYLQRHDDVNKTSGVGRVWDGVIFSNGWVAGKWNSDTSSYGWYPGIDHVKQIHGHGGKTDVIIQDVCSNQNSFLYIEALDPEETTDMNTLVAEGCLFNTGWICLLHIAKYTSVYWYRSLAELQFISSKRSRILFVENDLPALDISMKDPIWEREKIFMEKLLT